ncbi:hypothetical protein [Paractinoplanes durhamensis]
MSQPLQVAVQALQRYGREQFEDAAIYNALRNYLLYVGTVPEGAWGELPWSATWRDRWALGLEHRAAEAQLISEHTGEHAAAILKVAADYTDTDQQVALNFDLQNEYVSPFLAAYGGGYTSTGVYKPGTDGGAPYFDSPTVFTRPDNTDEFKKLNAERMAGDSDTLMPCTVSNPAGINFSAGMVGDELDHFVEQYGEDMLCTEYIARQRDYDGALPFTDYILPAWRSLPGLIRNRAELLYPAQHAYTECYDEMKLDIATVRDNWFSPGAALAWFRQANAHLNYLDAISDEVKWLGDQGIAAATLVEGLRNRYAEYGHNRAKDCIELAKAVLDAEADMLGGIGDCKTNPVKALGSALKGFANVLFIELRQKHDAAINLINVDEQRRKEQTDPGTLAHDTHPFPEANPGWANGKD